MRCRYALVSCLGLEEGSSSLRQVWMSHGDQLSEPPKDFHVIGYTQSAPYAALAHNSKPFYGIQFHPEVTHSPQGKEVIGSFILNICQCRPHWTMVFFFLFVCAYKSLMRTSSCPMFRKNSSARKSCGSEIFVVQRVA